MAHAQIDVEFGQRFRASFLQRRRDALSDIVKRADGRGELRPGLSHGTVSDIVFGVIWYRLLATDRPLDARLVDELVATLAQPHAEPVRRKESVPRERGARRSTIGIN
jgi:hypothetical protein